MTDLVVISFFDRCILCLAAICCMFDGCSTDCTCYGSAILDVNRQLVRCSVVTGSVVNVTLQIFICDV